MESTVQAPYHITPHHNTTSIPPRWAERREREMKVRDPVMSKNISVRSLPKTSPDVHVQDVISQAGKSVGELGGCDSIPILNIYIYVCVCVTHDLTFNHDIY